ncbi:response regulator transcription factor [Bacillus sp. DNRA2]|uniref:response regulator transcription factor n=1 Tax=Bacillus sp. DNRA2 TaxID=2723053 RepID=UPI00145F38FC|nr:response regulator transcription factor [Bacillus sp. DNRA2]NMD71281.1 response regulator transcription factor [Bacillus sp. DNRA2]
MAINVLLVDDDTEYAQSLREYGAQENIDILHVQTLVEMQEFLPKVASGVSAVILDIKGMITPEDEFDDEGFLARAITYLDKEYYTKPRVILTGDVEGFKYVQKYRKGEQVYRKGNSSEKEMFTHIKEIHKKIDEIVIMKEYESIFEIFERNLLDISRREELIQIIKNIDSKDNTTIKNSLGRIRDIQEDIVKKINSVNKIILPDNQALNDRREISFRKSHRHLKNSAASVGYEFPKFINEPILATYSVSCDYGVHTANSANSGNIKPTSYTVKAALYSLLDFMLWFKNVVL